jgi:chemotaxis protein CheC
MSLPIVIRGDSKHMFESTASSLVLFLHIKFDIRQKEIGGYVALLMDIPSGRGLPSLTPCAFFAASASLAANSSA